jgi:hypothetical protein
MQDNRNLSLKLIGLLVLISALMFLVGCGGGGGGNNTPPPPSTGTVTVKVAIPSGLRTAIGTRSVSEITNVKVTISGADMENVFQDLTIDLATRTAEGKIEVKAGERLIKVEAQDVSGATLYAGEKTITVEAGKTIPVEISLKNVGVGEVIIDIIIHTGVPDIKITDFGDNLTGIVTGGTDPALLQVAVYIKVGGGWWTKPYWASSSISIGPDGNWGCDITTGGSDRSWTEARAYLLWKTTSIPGAAGGGLPDIPTALTYASVTR